MMRLSGVRARIVLVALVMAAPMLGLELWQAAGNRDRAITQALSRVMELARLAASEEDDSLQEAANLLRVLKRVPVVADAVPGECHGLLREITNEHPRLDTISVLRPDGTIACTSLGPVPTPINLADREWFRDVARENSPSTVISEFLISRSTGQPTVVVSTAFGHGNTRGAVAATMNLAWFSEIAARIPGPQGATVVVVDARDGSILARSVQSAEWVGRHFAEHRLIAMIRSQAEGAMRLVGFDGVEQIVGFRRLPGDLRSHTVVLVGLPVAEVLAEADAQLRSGLALMVLMLVAGMAMAWVLASYSIIRPLDALGRAARRLGDGDVTAQATMPTMAVDELARLATVFNQAVAQIADRDLRLEKLAMQDALTGLANRRYFDVALTREWAHAARSLRPMALIMIDVDHFKRYNDRYGHPAGDSCLRTVATAIEDAVRQSSDTAARYGGEEFAIIVPDTDVMGAMRLAERLVRQITALRVTHQGAPSGRLSISVGVAGINPALVISGAETNAQWLVDAADAALYRAKNAGRGCAMFHHPAAIPDVATLASTIRSMSTV